MRILSLLLLISHLMPVTGIQAQSRDITYMSSGGKLNPLQAIMDIRHYTLRLDIDIDAKKINGSAEIDLVLSKATDTLLFDLVHLLAVTTIKVNEKQVNFSQKDDKLFIVSGKGFKKGAQKIVVNYGGEPPVAVKPPWNGGFTWTW